MTDLPLERKKSSIDLTKGLSDVKSGYVPDFGFRNDLNFGTSPANWGTVFKKIMTS